MEKLVCVESVKRLGAYGSTIQKKICEEVDKVVPTLSEYNKVTLETSTKNLFIIPDFTSRGYTDILAWMGDTELGLNKLKRICDNHPDQTNLDDLHVAWVELSNTNRQCMRLVDQLCVGVDARCDLYLREYIGEFRSYDPLDEFQEGVVEHIQSSGDEPNIALVLADYLDKDITLAPEELEIIRQLELSSGLGAQELNRLFKLMGYNQ